VSEAGPLQSAALRREALRVEALRVEALRLEALRLNDRYLREVVLEFGLCPWADRVIEGQQLRRAVDTAADPAVASALLFIDQLETAGPDAPIGFLIFPCATIASPAFDRYVEEVRRADRNRRREAVGRPDFVMAAFHPDAAETFATPYQLVSFLRRTPDPTIQLVRADRLAQTRAAHPSVSDDVAQQNHATVTARGADTLDRVLRAIRADRDRSYAAIRTCPSG
jgi:hypothetical protein